MLDLPDSMISRNSKERDGRYGVDFGPLYWPTPAEFRSEVQSSRKNVDEGYYGSPAARIHLDDSVQSVLAQLFYGIEDDMPTLMPDADVLSRQFFASLFSRRAISRTVTTWVTTFSVSTVTSTPGCSVAGELNQCPSG